MTLLTLASTCLLLLTLGYSVRCWLSPFGRCRTCHGMGHAIKHDRKGQPTRGKACRRCNGHGIRIRLGRHLINRWHHTYERGTR